MEFFTKTKAVKLRSHLDKYLIADDDQETVRQSRNGTTRKARWFVEVVESKKDVIRLKSYDGRYLTASDLPFLLGMTGKKVIQTVPEKITDWKLEWEPIRDGFQVRLKSWCGKFLRGNGGTPPWRNSVTHDEPHTGATQKWILWDVEALETESLAEYLSSMSSNSSVSDDVLEAISDEYNRGSEPGSPISVVSSVRTPRLTVVKSMSPRLMPKKVCLCLNLVNYDLLVNIWISTWEKKKKKVLLLFCLVLLTRFSCLKGKKKEKKKDGKHRQGTNI